MANYTAADVKRLRDITGSGMMDCKKSLEEADGDFDKAIEALRIKGAKDVGKRAERTTANGLVAAADGVMVELNCETDFVAKNAEFQQLADRIVQAAKATEPAEVDELNQVVVDGKTVADLVHEASAKIGEKLQVRRVACYGGSSEIYLHKRAADLPPAVGVMVEYTGDGSQSAEVARGAAMQVAAMKPRFLTRDQVPSETVEAEQRIAEQTAKEEGKPEQAIPKIVDGRVNAFFKDNVLLEQPSVQDSKLTVQAQLEQAGVSLTRFARFEVGQA